MDINLFANFEEITEKDEKTRKSNLYDEMLEKRVRPVAPESIENNPVHVNEIMEEQALEIKPLIKEKKTLKS